MNWVASCQGTWLAEEEEGLLRIYGQLGILIEIGGKGLLLLQQVYALNIRGSKFYYTRPYGICHVGVECNSLSTGGQTFRNHAKSPGIQVICLSKSHMAGAPKGWFLMLPRGLLGRMDKARHKSGWLGKWKSGFLENDLREGLQ